MTSANVQSLQSFGPESSTTSDAPSGETTELATTGPKLTEVVRQAWLSPFSTKSNFARFEADWVAAAASSGLITTRVGDDTFGHLWRVTAKGLALIQDWTE